MERVIKPGIDIPVLTRYSVSSRLDGNLSLQWSVSLLSCGYTIGWRSIQCLHNTLVRRQML